MANKSQKQTLPPPSPSRYRLAHAIAVVARAPAALTMVWPVLLVVGGYFAWQHWGAEHVGRQFSRLQVSQIILTEPPEYIRSDVREQVFADMGLDGVSMLDKQATARLAQAFGNHPWIKQVVRVCKVNRNKIEVHVRYRRPVAMVAFESDHPDVKGWAYDPVDKEGIVLPQTDFQGKDVKNYIKIIIPNVRSMGNPGFPFGDASVSVAAQIAGMLDGHHKQLGLRAIGLLSGSDQGPNDIHFQLTTNEGKSIIWGSPPGKEFVGEPNAAEKVKRLLEKSAICRDLRVAGPASSNAFNSGLLDTTKRSR